MFGVQLTHSDETEIGQVGFSAPVTLRQSGQLREVFVAVQREAD